MQITQHRDDEVLELRLAGRIDASWGDHLSTTIQEAVRAGYEGDHTRSAARTGDTGLRPAPDAPAAPAAAATPSAGAAGIAHCGGHVHECQPGQPYVCRAGGQTQKVSCVVERK